MPSRSNVPLRHLFQRMLARYMERAVDSPYLMMLFLGSILLSIASFYTTFDGMLAFMPVWIFSAFITFAVQALLFVTSWQLGFMFASREKRSWLTIAVFVVTFCTSVFFSFSSLFNYIFDPGLQERTRDTRIRNAVEETITDLEITAKERRKVLVEALVASDAYGAWRKNVLAVAEVAARAEDELADTFNRRFETQRAETTDAARELQRLLAKKGTLDRDVMEGEARLERITEQREPLLKDVARWQDQLAAADGEVIAKKAQMDAEATGGDPGSGRPAGKGPVWEKLSKEHNVLVAQRTGVSKQLALSQAALDRLDAERSTVRQQLDEDRVLKGSIDTEIASAREREEQLRSQLDRSGGQEGFNMDDSVETLRGYLTQFGKEFDLIAFDRAANMCANLLEEMRKIEDLRDGVSDLSCDRGAMTTAMNPINDVATALSALQRECSAGGDSAKVVSSLPYAEALAYARHCMNISGLPSREIRGLRLEIDRLEREEDDAASPFTKTSNAILSGEKLALFSLAIALTIDLLVLFSGLIGARTVRSKIMAHIDGNSDAGLDDDIFKGLELDLEIRPTDKPKTRKIKQLLRHAQPYTGQSGNIRYDACIDLNDIVDSRTRDDLSHNLVSFVGKGLATPDRNAERIFYLRYGLLDALRHDLAQDMERAKLFDDILAQGGERQSRRPADPVATAAPGNPIVWDTLSSSDVEQWHRHLDEVLAAREKPQAPVREKDKDKRDSTPDGYADHKTKSENRETASPGGPQSVEAVDDDDENDLLDEFLDALKPKR